jgi:hypothetical protein
MNPNHLPFRPSRPAWPGPPFPFLPGWPTSPLSFTTQAAQPQCVAQLACQPSTPRALDGTRVPAMKAYFRETAFFIFFLERLSLPPPIFPMPPPRSSARAASSSRLEDLIPPSLIRSYYPPSTRALTSFNGLNLHSPLPPLLWPFNHPSPPPEPLSHPL